MSRRDKLLLLLALAALVLAGAIAAGVYVATRSSSPPQAACLSVDVPSTMGGGHLKECGAAARQFCLEQAKREPAIATACRRQGFLSELKPKP